LHKGISEGAFASSDGLNAFLAEHLESQDLLAFPAASTGILSPAGLAHTLL
jgi:hypothetical protein